MADFSSAFKKIIGLEGGYSDREADAGGRTMYGISEKIARHYGYNGPMDELDLVTARGIYATGYWHLLKLDVIHKQAVAEEIFDIAVNCGVCVAAKYMQRVANVLNRYEKDWDDIKLDGWIGPVTIAAVNAAADKREANYIKALNILQGHLYFILAENRERLDELNINGWLEKRITIK